MKGRLAMWSFERKNNMKICHLNLFILIPGSAVQRCRTAEGDDEEHANTVQSTEVSISIG
jgi:hypothetical protein